MTEDEARDWLGTQFSASAVAKLERFVQLLRVESEQQSLIARSTFDTIWSRHIVDSAQLAMLAPPVGNWLDIGSGGGLPGIVVAILRDEAIVLCEPRRKRVEFLQGVMDTLDISNAVVAMAKVQNVEGRFAVISARAVAPMPDLFAWTRHNVSRETRFLLPRGQSWASELEIAQRAWHGSFHVEQSLTDTESRIVVAEAVTLR